MQPGSADLLQVVPDFALGDLVRFVGWFLVAVVLPGHAIRQGVGLRPADFFERWALACVFGVLATSFLYFFLAMAGLQGLHGPLVLLMAGLAGLCVVYEVRGRRRRLNGQRAARRLFRRLGPAGVAGLVVVAVLAVGHVVRVASLVEWDASGVRLYGAFFSDKMTNMSPCAALMEGVPPAALRISGYVFPSHYFPHLFVAAADRAVGVDYVDGFWFHAAALGVVIRSLAVLAFCRRFLPSAWPACAALVLFGLTRFTPDDKPLDLSFALLLLAILAVDRYACAGRRRWGVLAVCLLAAMPLYEVFTAAAALGGLVVWSIVPALGMLRRRRAAGRPAGAAPGPPGAKAPPIACASWLRETARRLPISLLACLGALLAVRLLYVGAQIESRPEPIARNSYLDSYKHEWRDLLRDAEGEHPVLATLYRWKRGKAPEAAPGDSGAAARRPGFLQQAVGEIVYNAGFVAYFLVRFVNLGLFGVVALVVALRRGARGSPTAWAAIAAICAFGFAVPCVVTWGHTAEDRWYETPNIYRLAGCGYLLLLLVGLPILLEAIRRWHRPRWWIPLALAGWQLWLLAGAQVLPATQYHHVDLDRLGALRFLRTEVPWGEVVLHPWVHDLVRDARRPDEVAWVYKRHFTLGSNLAGCQMFYEGREDHLFINGFVTGEEVFARRRLRDAFYAEPTPEVIRRVVDEGRVRWVVCDDENPAPAEIRSTWQLVHTSGAVRVYHRPAALPRRSGGEPSANRAIRAWAFSLVLKSG